MTDQSHCVVQFAHFVGVPRLRPAGDVEHRRDHLPGEPPHQHLVEQERGPGEAAVFALRYTINRFSGLMNARTGTRATIAVSDSSTTATGPGSGE